MYRWLIQFASTEATEDSGILGALGIDVPTLVFQAIAFLLLLVVLRKFIFPILIRTVDARQEAIEAAARAADDAKKQSEDAQRNVKKTLDIAQQQAVEIVATARQEAEAIQIASEQKAKKRADAIVQRAHEQIEKEVSVARDALHDEILELVVNATEKVAEVRLDRETDARLIEDAIAGAGRS